ncbi:DUF2490 domain-containing protein [Mesohalobacter halotolerans]|uniref:DUF2490 domain-containing protein n=1 Tax=Mesohalobacter halotolerans TaxID=1883405 RepID=A0A4U5TQP2_9FLAO|nr:DUF2490 domain-containing protein [Mesohalobacter halotolerans]MBS3739237.1 DUF2490 domain-containing protein [Psychroflexus sp.]TKS56519.1 DUF2490 domain-containing protein [Mesohalobacter halotolerans]
MRQFLIIIFCLIGLLCSAQNVVAGFLPDFTLSYKASEQYKIVHKLESRFPSYNDTSEDINVQFERLDMQNFIERKIGLFSKLSLGYQYRIKDSAADEHRFIQQFSWTDNLTAFRIGHRLRSDQTYSRARKPEIRFRYRSGFQFPLQGQQLDAGEYYLSISDELVWSYRSPNADLENRVLAKLGLYINDKNKIEWGLEWRLEELFLEKVNHQLWVGLSWYKAL